MNPSMCTCRQFTWKRTIVPLLVLLCFISRTLPSRGRIAKRVAQGEQVLSQDDFGTYHFVHLREAWGCIGNQDHHELKGCRESAFCGGTLIHLKFVLTASHCVSYLDFYWQNITKVYDIVHILTGDLRADDDTGFWTLLHRAVRLWVLKPKYKHSFYSNVALMAGGVDYFGMTQKRHAEKIFPHPYYAKGNFSLLDHDVALIEACQAFKEAPRTVKPAPMKPLNELYTQWKNIVKRAPACLYVGFGDTDDLKTVFHLSPRNTIPTRYMRYTWRFVECSTNCNRNRSLGWDQPKNPCMLCSNHIPPKIGTPGWGDSGGPIVCDGYYVAVHLSLYYTGHLNLSKAYGYPLYCIKDALTPQRLIYYHSVEASENPEFHPLGPVLRRFYYN